MFSRHHDNAEVQRQIDAPFVDSDANALRDYYIAAVRHAFVEFMGAHASEMGPTHHEFFRVHNSAQQELVPRARAKLIHQHGPQAAEDFEKELLVFVKEALQPELDQEQIRILAAREKAARPAIGQVARQATTGLREVAGRVRTKAQKRYQEYQKMLDKQAKNSGQPEKNHTGRGRLVAGSALALGGAAAGMLHPSPAAASEHVVVSANVQSTIAEQVYAAETANQTIDPYKLNPHPQGLDKATLARYLVLKPYIETSAALYEVPAWIMAGDGETESNDKLHDTSSAGAMGPWQFMPSTWESYKRDANHNGVTSPEDPADAADANARKLRDLYRQAVEYKHQGRLTGDAWELALTAYNCGMGNVLRFGHVPTQAEADASSHINSEPVTYSHKVISKGQKYKMYTTGAPSAPATVPKPTPATAPTKPDQNMPDLLGKLDFNPSITKTPPTAPALPAPETDLFTSLTSLTVDVINSTGDTRETMPAPTLPGVAPESTPSTPNAAPSPVTPTQPVTKAVTPTNPWTPAAPSLPPQVSAEQATPPSPNMQPSTPATPESTLPTSTPDLQSTLGSLASSTIQAPATPETKPNVKTNPTTSDKLVWPVPGNDTVTSGYHHPDRPGHYAMDIAAKKGTPVVAVASGTVIFASEGYNGGYGNNVKLLVTDNKALCGTSDSCTVVYAHLSEINVKEGQRVTAGTTLGKAG
ncbi:MAG TPA: peptidoglycan DD-metalloendopeptidase family protein, partial [Candidatus Saccharimonadales bacterium]|nr:peptidoglycan DD-metalloendopeptidase family protein [Candidatus Saccharimonadales bacterium]